MSLRAKTTAGLEGDVIELASDIHGYSHSSVFIHMLAGSPNVCNLSMCSSMIQKSLLPTMFPFSQMVLDAEKESETERERV